MTTTAATDLVRESNDTNYSNERLSAWTKDSFILSSVAFKAHLIKGIQLSIILAYFKDNWALKIDNFITERLW